MHVLVCGGAGYIGSHMVKMLHERGHRVSTLDNLSTGHREAVRWGDFVEADIRDQASVTQILANLNPDAVMHFSARSLVGESVNQPAEYYDNNLVGTWCLLQAMRQVGIQRFIFSSTAAVYGNPEQQLIAEDHPTRPINPYGQTKLAVERMLCDYSSAYGLRSASMRYFNAAGADASGQIGESHQPETHLIPNVLKSMLAANNECLKVFGNDYPTEDGTCIRDYIHVNDLAEAHLLALEYLDTADGCHTFNLGNGDGFSVLDIIRSASDVLGQSIPYRVEPRRPGDPPVLVANARKARDVLGWQPIHADIASIVESAWNWHQNATF